MSSKPNPRLTSTYIPRFGHPTKHHPLPPSPKCSSSPSSPRYCLPSPPALSQIPTPHPSTYLTLTRATATQFSPPPLPPPKPSSPPPNNQLTPSLPSTPAPLPLCTTTLSSRTASTSGSGRTQLRTVLSGTTPRARLGKKRSSQAVMIILDWGSWSLVVREVCYAALTRRNMIPSRCVLLSMGVNELTRL